MKEQIFTAGQVINLRKDYEQQLEKQKAKTSSWKFMAIVVIIICILQAIASFL